MIQKVKNTFFSIIPVFVNFGCAKILCVSVMLIISYFVVLQNNSIAQEKHSNTDAVHLGVKTCGNSACHASAQPWQNSAVGQNEYITWSQESSHSKAYLTLQNSKSKRIAKNLGINDPTKENMCLNCHADNVPKSKQGNFFDIADGVGCESCHGGAENWLGQHVSGMGSHTDNLNLGMNPTDNIFFKTNLCASCHIGTKEKYVVHKLFGAGHPRLIFEIDTFLVNQPSHHRVDSDYLIRKSDPDRLKMWALGQVLSTKYTLNRLSDVKLSTDGMFPELSLFDCHACHRSLTKIYKGKKTQKTFKKVVGIPRINDSNLIMLGILSKVIAPNLSEKIVQGPNLLHQATSQSMNDVATEAKKLLVSIEKLSKILEKTEFNNDIRNSLFISLLRSGSEGIFRDFTDAEQATMAIASILAYKSDEQSSKLSLINYSDLEAFYEVTKNFEEFFPDEFQSISKKILTKVN